MAKRPGKNRGTLHPVGAFPSRGTGKVIRHIELRPLVLVGNEECEVILTFAPDLKYVKVTFSLTNKNLKISCEGTTNKDCTFEFAFGDGDPRRKSFMIKAITITEETDEPIDIFYTATKGAPLEKDAEQRWLKLRPRRKLPENVFVSLFLWLWDVSKRWYIRYPLIAAAALGALFYFRVLSYEGIEKSLDKISDRVQIRWIGNRPPHRYVGRLANLLEPTDDGRPSPQQWDSAPPEWSIKDRTLHVRGAGLGLVKVPVELHALYNYKAVLKLRVTAGLRGAAWVLRAKDRQHYYLFELALPSQSSPEARLKGFLYEDGETKPLTSITPTLLNYYPLDDGDLLTVAVEATNYEVKHTITLTLVNDTLENRNLPFDSEERIVTFIDGDNRYEYGSMGLKANGENDEVLVEYMEITAFE